MATSEWKPGYWKYLHETTRLERKFLKAVMLLWAIAVSGMLILSFRNSLPVVAALFVLLASPIPIGVMAAWIERRSLRQLLNPKKQSWAFLSDIFALAPLAAILALAWPTLPKDRWYDQWYWYVAAVGFGIAAAAAFRHSEAGGYDVLRYDSPSKLAHDFIAYPALFPAMVYGLVPVLAVGEWSSWPSYPSLAVFFGGLWLLCGIADIVRMGLNNQYRMDGKFLHVQTDEHGHSIPDLPDVPTPKELKAK